MENKETLINKELVSCLFVCKKTKKFNSDFILQKRYYLLIIKPDKKFLSIYTVKKNNVKVPILINELFTYFRPISNKNIFYKKYVIWLKKQKQKQKEGKK